ncbi:MAG: response regulator [Lachnospiraceae bacterium]|nr:response regulator [Lachnospiraceae bacterium]
MANILIVDDSRISRRVLRNSLELMGHTVVAEAGNGDEALTLYEEHHPDLVTMDITMPGMDGIECLFRMREMDPEAKVIMITAAGTNDKMVKAVKYGCLDYIVKPFDEELLREVITKHTA